MIHNHGPARAQAFPELHALQDRSVVALRIEVVQEEQLVPAFELGAYGISHGQGPDSAAPDLMTNHTLRRSLMVIIEISSYFRSIQS